MRRIAFAVAMLSALALGACSSGGSVFNTGGGAQHTIVTASGSSALARVLPGGSIPLSATAVSGSQNGYSTNNQFTWSAALTTGLSYQYTTDGNAWKPCASVSQTIGGTTTPYTADFSIYVTIDPSNESNVIFSPPPIIPAPPGGTIATNYPYCVVVSATPVQGGGSNSTGSITVVVANPLNPLQ